MSVAPCVTAHATVHVTVSVTVHMTVCVTVHVNIYVTVYVNICATVSGNFIPSFVSWSLFLSPSVSLCHHLCHCVTICITVYRTAVNAQSGVRTQLGGVFTGLFFVHISIVKYCHGNSFLISFDCILHGGMAIHSWICTKIVCQLSTGQGCKEVRMHNLILN